MCLEIAFGEVGHRRLRPGDRIEAPLDPIDDDPGLLPGPFRGDLDMGADGHLFAHPVGPTRPNEVNLPSRAIDAYPEADQLLVLEHEVGAVFDTERGALIDCPLPEIFYGGARGGGKTDGIIGKYAIKGEQYGAAFNAIFFRRELPMADDAIERSQEILGGLGWTYNAAKYQWRSPAGARLRFRPLERVTDAEKYQGQNLTDAAVEEAGNTASSTSLSSSRPSWRTTEPFSRRIRTTSTASIWSVLINSSKPGLMATGAPSRAHSSTAGVSERHVIEPFSIPEHWHRFRAGDWGSAAPFSFGWYAVVDGKFPGLPEGHPARTLVRGCLVRYREWYGEGKKLTTEEVADGIKEREAGDANLTYGVLDPSAFAMDGGPSIAERMAGKGVRWRPADNKRVTQRGAMGGWDQMRARLKGNAEGQPMLVFFSTCTNAIRTIPVLQHDPDKAEDLDTEAEDHAADEVRYACMSRPYIKEIKKPEPPTHQMIGLPGGQMRTGLTIMEIIERNAKAKRREAVYDYRAERTRPADRKRRNCRGLSKVEAGGNDAIERRVISDKPMTDDEWAEKYANNIVN